MTSSDVYRVEVCRVLVVDDNADDRADLRRLLLRGSDRRYLFTEAASGAAALELLHGTGWEAVDCVLLDYHLPDMDARQVLAQICQLSGRPPCPVLVVTGATAKDGASLVRAGAQDYIGKAWTTPESLTHAVENAIERFAMQGEALRAQLQLALQRERLDQALAAGQMGVFELNLADGSLHWSPEVYTLFGVTPDAFTPSRSAFRTLVHPEDRAIPWQSLHEVSADLQPTTVEFRIRRPDGEWRWMAHRGQTTQVAGHGQPPHLRHFGVVFDITQRKQAVLEKELVDQRLRDQQFYTRSLIESSIDALVITDPVGLVADLNRQMELLSGRSRAELIGTPFMNLFSEPHRAQSGLALALQHSRLLDYDLTLVARDGGQTVVSLNASTIYDRQRVLQGVFVAARDVTQRRFLEQALQETNVALERDRFMLQQDRQATSVLRSTG